MASQTLARYQGNSSPGRLVDTVGGSSLVLVGTNITWPTVASVPGCEGDHWLYGQDLTLAGQLTDYLQIPLSARGSNNGWRISYSIKTNSTHIDVNHIIFHTINADLSGNRYLFCYLQNHQFNFEYTDSTGADQNIWGGPAIDDGAVHTVLVNGDQNGVKLYVDGALVATSAIPFDWGSGTQLFNGAGNNASIGSSAPLADEYLYIDDVLFSGLETTPNKGSLSVYPMKRRRR